MATNELTQAGLNKLKAELDELKNKKRPAVIKRIKEARELGDLSENADYQDAREEQAFIEGRIKELESSIKDARVISGTSKPGTISIGSKVDVELNGEHSAFEIVGPSEADPSAGTISNASPIGQALIGKKAGDIATVNAPDGVLEYRITNVS